MNETIGWKRPAAAHKRNWFVTHDEERIYYMNKKDQLIWFGSPARWHNARPTC